jgi:hypothetical protein
MTFHHGGVKKKMLWTKLTTLGRRKIAEEDYCRKEEAARRRLEWLAILILQQDLSLEYY